MIGTQREWFKRLVAAVESGGGRHRTNKQSGASGSYQFLPSTIKLLIDKYPTELSKYKGMSAGQIANSMRSNSDPKMEEDFYNVLVDDQRRTISNWGGDPNDPVAHMLMHRQPRVAREYIKAGGGKAGFAAVKDIKFADGLETAGQYLSKFKAAEQRLDPGRQWGLFEEAAPTRPLGQVPKATLPAPTPAQKTYAEDVNASAPAAQASVMTGPKVAPPQEINMATQDSNNTGGGAKDAMLRAFMKAMTTYVDSQRPAPGNPQIAPVTQRAPASNAGAVPPTGTPTGTMQTQAAGQALAANTESRRSPSGWEGATQPTNPANWMVPPDPRYLNKYGGETEVGPSPYPASTGRLGPSSVNLPLETSTGAQVYPGSAQSQEAPPYYLAKPDDYVTRDDSPPFWDQGQEKAMPMLPPAPPNDVLTSKVQQKPGLWKRILNTILPHQPFGYERGRRDYSAEEQAAYNKNVPGFEQLPMSKQRKYDKAVDRLDSGKLDSKPRKKARAEKQKSYLEMLATASQDGDLTSQEKMDAYQKVYPNRAKWRLGPFFGPDFRGEI